MRRLVPFLALLLLPACSDLLTTAAATVDGRKIEEDRFVRELDFLLADPRFAQQLAAGEEGELQRKELARQYLTFLIHQQVVQVYADDHDVEVEGQEVDALLEQQIAELGGAQAFEGLLRTANASVNDVRSLLSEQILRESVAEAVVEEQLTESQLRHTYEERALEFSQVHVAHILVETEEEALDILERATPQTFAKLAEQHSFDTGSAANGGDLGVQRPADLVQPFADATLDIPVGEVGGPVQTEFGWHLLHVIDRQTQPFASVRDSLLQELRGQVFTDWLIQQVQEAEIRVNPRYGYFDEASGSVRERTSTSPLPVPSIQLQP
ncbi:MAG: peptidylprolyl isomerase [Actinobacteria bacterium]|nr:peptidylprolyl isomerase [Actinomycetota bacterium]